LFPVIYHWTLLLGLVAKKIAKHSDGYYFTTADAARGITAELVHFNVALANTGELYSWVRRQLWDM